VSQNQFYEISRMYAAIGRPCDAITPLKMYLSFDAAKRQSGRRLNRSAHYAYRHHVLFIGGDLRSGCETGRDSNHRCTSVENHSSGYPIDDDINDNIRRQQNSVSACSVMSLAIAGGFASGLSFQTRPCRKGSFTHLERVPVRKDACNGQGESRCSFQFCRNANRDLSEYWRPRLDSNQGPSA
jgi:hypothetical protein